MGSHDLSEVTVRNRILAAQQPPLSDCPPQPGLQQGAAMGYQPRALPHPPAGVVIQESRWGPPWAPAPYRTMTPAELQVAEVNLRQAESRPMEQGQGWGRTRRCSDAC
jgi:hypothetical protein